MSMDPAQAAEDRADIDALRRAAHVLRRRSSKRHSIVRDVIRRVLTDLADIIEAELEDAS
jgi:hypothetical protein